MNTLDLIHEEHATMLALYQALGYLLDEISVGHKPDHPLLATMLDYILHEPEELHHPKEDRFLFVILRERDEGCAALIDRLAAQHEEGRTQAGSLAATYIRYVSQGDEGFEAFEASCRRYIAAAQKHIALEERELLPRAREILTLGDIKELDRLYSENGNSPAGEFRDIFRKVANRLPAPYGLGSRWSS